MYCPGYRPQPLIKAVRNNEIIFIYNNETTLTFKHLLRWFLAFNSIIITLFATIYLCDMSSFTNIWRIMHSSKDRPYGGPTPLLLYQNHPLKLLRNLKITEYFTNNSCLKFTLFLYMKFEHREHCIELMLRYRCLQNAEGNNLSESK